MKKVNVYISSSMREMISVINDSQIKKEDIVSLIQDNRSDEFILVYYK